MTQLLRSVLLVVGGVTGVIALSVGAWALGRWLTASLDGDVAGFDAGMIATVLGIVVGVPVAVGISLWLRRMERASTVLAERLRYEFMLTTIDDDLRDALEELLREGPNDRQPRDAPVAPFLGSGLWRALQASGQVESVSDPLLLRQIDRSV